MARKTIDTDKWKLEASGGGKPSDFFGAPFFTRLMKRLEGMVLKTEKTITGGWAIFSKKK